ncbi:hypothetical protein ABIB57_004341 [Devosia sp. UYZn731]
MAFETASAVRITAAAQTVFIDGMTVISRRCHLMADARRQTPLRSFVEGLRDP